MIIIEGPDNAGKSTLAKTLADDISSVTKWNPQVWHAGGPGFGPNKLTSDLEKLSKVIVMDRVSFVSEPIYAQSVGRDTDADFYACQALANSLLVHKSCFMIHVTGELNRLLDFSDHEVKAHETKEHVQAVKNNARNVIMHYGHFMAPFLNYSCFHKYDYTVDRYARLLENCLAYINWRMS